MKLHLPKLLLAAVMATFMVHSSWGAFSGPGADYADGGTITASPTVTGDTAYTLQTNNVDINAANGDDKFDIKLSGGDEFSLGTIVADSLWISNGRYTVNSNNDLLGVGTVYINGASALQFYDAATISSDLSIGTSSYVGSGWIAAGADNLCNAAVILGVWNKTGQSVLVEGDLTVQEDARIAFQYGYSANLTGALKGAGNLNLSWFTGGAGTLTLTGDTSGYYGAISFTGGNVSLNLGDSDVHLGGLNGGANSNTISLASDVESSALTLEVAEGKSYTYTGVLGAGISIVKTGAGSQTLSGQTLSSDVTVSAGTLTLTNITTTGDIEIGGSGSLVIADTITNNGTLDLTASNISLGDSLTAYTVKQDGSVTYTVDNDKQNGFQIQNGAQLFLVQGSGATVAEGAQASMGDTAYNLNSDDTGIWFTSGNYTSSSFYISEGDVEVIGAGAEGATGAEKYVLQGGTMNLTAGSVDRSAIEYTSGAIATGNTAEISGLNSVTDAALIDHITGNGTLKIAETDTTGTNGYNGTITTSEGFTGKVYVTSGNFTLSSTTHGETIQLANGVNMQITANSTFEKNMILDSGDHQIHTNGKTLTISGNISGAGTLDKRASGSITIADGATIANYKHSAGTTNVTGGSVTNLTNVGATVNISGGSVTTLSTTGGTTTVSGGSVSNMISTGGTTDITGSVSIGGGANFNSTHVSGIYLKENGTVNIGDGTTTNTVTVTRVEMGDNQSANGGVLNVKSNATLVITGGDVTDGQNSYHKTGFLLGEWEAASTVNVAGKLLAENATLFVGDKTANVVIDNGGIMAVKGIGLPKVDNGKTQAINLTLNDGGKIVLGEAGINTSRTFSGVLGAGTIGISADAAINTALALKSSTGTTFDTQKYVWGEGGASIALGTEGGTLSISAVVADHTDSSGKLVKAGAGTLQLNAANTYSGGTDINAGTVKTGNATALGTGAVSVDTDASLELGTSLTVSDLTIEEGGSLIFGNDTTLTVTGTLTLAATAINFAKDITFSSADAVTLATAGTLNVTGVDSWKGAYTIGDKAYTAGLSAVDNVLSLTFEEVVTPENPSITTTLETSITDVLGYANGMLTLQVEGLLTDSTMAVVDILGDPSTDALMAKVLGLVGDTKAVAITLEGTLGGEIVADAFNKVVFVNEKGEGYYGESVMVGGHVMYNVDRIPEPTTATLSLLALMGLAARRRRK